jgi:mono/diheme cytochrome c family protein
MKFKRVKLFAIAFFVLPTVALVIFNTKSVGTIVTADTYAEETYKTKCTVCHSPKADKNFDPAKKDEEHIEVILKGKKGEKPPFMPGFELNGMTAEQAKELVAYMRKLREGGEKKSDAKLKAEENTKERSREAIAAYYETNCKLCHGAEADKLYDPSKKEEESVQAILKGKKSAKPPFMPAFEAKGVTEKQAKALIAYMIELRTPSN